MAKRAQIDAVRPVLTALDHEVTAAEHVIDSVISGADKATDVLEHGLEKAADVVPDVLDKGVHAAAEVTRHGVRALRDPRKVAIIVVLASAAAGAGLGVAGYFLLKKRMESKYEIRLERELEEMRKFYIRRNKDGEFATPRTAAEALLAQEALDALKEYKERTDEQQNLEERIDEALHEEPPVEDKVTRYDKVVTNSEAAKDLREKVVTIEETPNRNIFVDGKPLVEDDWDQEAEESRRDESKPYVISHDEFMANAFEHDQTDITWYAGDEVLADEKGDMIVDVDAIVGIENLTRFGQGSRDPRVVYVRNERLEADYEVGLNSGKFAEEVMGLRHSDDSTRLRRARWGDDE